MLTSILPSLVFFLASQSVATPPPVAASPVPRNPALPANALQAKEALNDSPRHGEYVDIRLPSGGTAIRTWVSYPERKDKAGVVIVIHEIYGLSEWIRAVADQLAREGFIAVAPDLVSGLGPNGGGTESVAGPDDVVALVRALGPEDTLARIAAVRKYALALPSASGTSATLGFCWGGARSFAYAAAEPALNAAVVYYGVSPETAELAKVMAPVLGLYGGDDARVNATIEPAKTELARVGRTYEPHVYDGAGHGFLKMQTARDGANQAATRQAWPRTIAFLRQHLSGSAPPAAASSTTALRPPVARKQAKKLRIHGDTLVDDYHWLRNKGTPEVEGYLKGELAYADAFMKPTAALQKELYDEMLSRIQQTDTNVPYRQRGHFYYSRTEEGKQYPIYARKKESLDAPEEVILDVNRLAEGKQFMSVGDRKVSPDENLLAYTTDDTGFRQYTLRVRDLRTGKDGTEAIPRVTAVEWSEDGSTLFYSVEDAQTKRSHQVFRHALGAAKDDLLYDEKDERFSAYVWKSRDRKYMFVESGSLTSTEIRFFPADQPRAEMRMISPREVDHQYDVDHRDGTFWIRTNDKGRNYRLVTAPVSDPARANWKEVIPHRDAVMLAGHSLFKDYYVLLEREGGFPRLRVTDFGTGQSHRIEVPEAASAISPGVTYEFDTPRYRFNYQSPITSPSVYDYDPATRERTLLKQDAVLGGYDPSLYKVEITEATAADGRRVPIWLLSRNDVKRDGSNPALLYAYGSYGSSNNPYFNSDIFSLVDRGVVYAVAYIRGGGELGKKWHDEGRMLNKKNTFTDFIAAAEHLVASRYTSKDRLAIMGGSAGGLLMGAVTNMRPDLFKIVVSYVPFVDVINTMLDKTLPLTVGEFEEWGNPEIAEQYRYMLSYSPYDQIARKPYPIMLVKSSYNDSQVMYWEPAKYVAKLRAMKTDANPLVFNINMDPAGHGGKSGRYERLRERAYDYAFILWQLGVEMPAAR